MDSIAENIGRVIIAKLLPHEDLIDAIKEIVMKHEIPSGIVNIIGAVNKATLGFYDINKKNYNFKTFEEPFELISCMGNITYFQEEPIVHLHVTLGREDLSIIGGHLSQPTIISITGEVIIFEINKKIFRSTDSQTKLTLLDLLN